MPIQPFPCNEEEACREITFSSKEIAFDLANEKATGQWIEKIIEREDKQLHSLNFIFCSDNYLHTLNVEYLGHDSLTDIITFPYATSPAIEADVFISIDRVRENARVYDVPFDEELARVMAHGVLHLCGYDDKTPAEKKQMRQKEDEALNIRNSGKV
ncbi:MAG TPA: rRNA maturation RNase YbeY, partial [Bacteroidetes bacterium]|nr:rRNA maturation RNase YbeY [Bacteroidota bacterium]